MNDGWVQAGQTTGLSKENLDSYLSSFDVLHFEEVDKVGNTALSGTKNWHFFDVISRKKEGLSGAT